MNECMNVYVHDYFALKLMRDSFDDSATTKAEREEQEVCFPSYRRCTYVYIYVCVCVCVCVRAAKYQQNIHRIFLHIRKKVKVLSM